jgi:hypothetical protein
MYNSRAAVLRISPCSRTCLQFRGLLPKARAGGVPLGPIMSCNELVQRRVELSLPSLLVDYIYIFHAIIQDWVVAIRVVLPLNLLHVSV